MNTEHDHAAHRVPFAKLFIVFLIQLVAIVAVYWWISPATLSSELAHPWKILAWTFLLGVPLSLFEYLYHRYLLHSAVLPFMASMHRAHSTHHGLTSVKAPVTPKEPERMVPVKSEYPVEEEHQEESMMFPFYSLPIFMAVFMIILGLPLKLIFPGQPVLISLILSVSIYLLTYEVWHAILHLPYERFWKPMLENRFTGRMAKNMYSFHLMHHWRPTANLAIVGFWGIALWDHVFRTHRRPENLPVNGAEVNYHDASIEKPLWPISALDNWQGKLYKASRTLERFLARVFLGRSTSR